ncbi:hypothetical protein AB595_04745 [Massilia sp. WF1]|uniref:hypothetical protein n=1 Tax=unclassified Massilia TaxID=2609279 RepID=UPI000649E584|nr:MULTISPECIES: hypothetical protein [unclassified Massilia]ALK96983.1 hypothetical protein AM586_12655 [Massilia sp. WG5]KLU37933.1 hypothetical protein AB595_04745 [Massilia sp. WF1]
MSTLEQRTYQGDQARLVLENEAFDRAFADIEQEHIEAWINAPARDVEGRESLWKTVKLLHKLRSTLETAMTDGKLAKVELEHQERMLAEERRQGLNLAGMT